MNRMIIIVIISFVTAAANAADFFARYQNLVEKHAAAQGLDKNLVWAVMGRESGGNPRATSDKDARGLMQVIPSTAARMGINPGSLYDPEQNIMAATRYLRFLSSRYNGNIDYILAGYNAGEGAVDKYRGIPPYRETQAYVVNVKQRYARLSGLQGGLQTSKATAASPIMPVSLKSPGGNASPPDLPSFQRTVKRLICC